MAAQLKPGEETVASMAEPRFRQKKGSVFPGKRKLVKKLAFESMVRTVSHVFSSPPSTSRSEMIKDGKIFPDPDGVPPEHHRNQQS